MVKVVASCNMGMLNYTTLSLIYLMDCYNNDTVMQYVVLRTLPRFLFAVWNGPNPPCSFFFFHLIPFYYSGNVIQNPFYISSNQVENKWEEAENEEKEENLWEQTDDDKEKGMQGSP